MTGREQRDENLRVWANLVYEIEKVMVSDVHASVTLSQLGCEVRERIAATNADVPERVVRALP